MGGDEGIQIESLRSEAESLRAEITKLKASSPSASPTPSCPSDTNSDTEAEANSFKTNLVKVLNDVVVAAAGGKKEAARNRAKLTVSAAVMSTAVSCVGYGIAFKIGSSGSSDPRETLLNSLFLITFVPFSCMLML